MDPTINYPRPHRWTREEFLQMIDLGWFQDKRVELIGGEVIETESQFDLHLASITLTGDQVRAAFGSCYWVLVQGSLDLSPHGIPDPDIAVTPGSPQGATKTIAKSALLVVEASETALAYDRYSKASLYAAGGIADYWIVNLVQRQLEVYRDPVADSTQLFGSRYNSRTILDPPDKVSPLAAPHAQIAVADLLP
ncbi:MAG TPA: Uma2 family endonuclease [Gemmataceae bacterium]|nr:Uma2 family endonuclease [Gemmataceae bacterium]